MTTTALTPYEVGRRIETLLDDLAGSAEPTVVRAAEELVRLLAQMYGAGLDRIVCAMRAGGPDGGRLLERLASDDLVSALLALHGVHPVDVETRINRALDGVRPYLGSHAGGIEFLGVDEDGVARLRLAGSCDGCPSSALTVRTAVVSAVEEAAPELAGIDVEGVVDEPERTPGDGTLLQIEPAPHRTVEEAWVKVDALPPLTEGQLASFSAGDTQLVACGVGSDLVAYRDPCPSCGERLSTGDLAGDVLTCAGCGGAFDVRHAGAAVGTSDDRLEPVPLLAGRHGGHRVALAAVPVGAMR